MRDEGKKRILVADDNQEIVDIVDILLTGEGYEVVKASNGQEAVELADDSHRSLYSRCGYAGQIRLSRLYTDSGANHGSNFISNGQNAGFR